MWGSVGVQVTLSAAGLPPSPPPESVASKETECAGRRKMDATEGNHWGDIKLDEKPHPPASRGLIPEDKVLLAAPGSLHMLFRLLEPTSFFGPGPVHHSGRVLDIT